MKIVLNTVVFAVIAVASATMAVAQPPGGGQGGHRGGPGGHGGNDPGRAVLMALDTDKNHEISAAEISNAPAALLELDSNGDGKLSDSDLASAGGRRGQGSRGERQRGKQEGAGSDRKNGPRGQHAGGPPEPAQMVEHAMQFDADGDGKLDATELLKICVMSFFISTF